MFDFYERSITRLEKEALEAELAGEVSPDRLRGIISFLLEKVEVYGHARYDTEFGDDKICKCGHPYYRHFDTYEDMAPVGCKYCDCDHWMEPGPNEQPLTQEEKQILIDAGWEFIDDDHIHIPNDYDGCMAYGIQQVRRILESVKKRKQA